MKNNSQNLSSQKNLRCPFYLTKYGGEWGESAGTGVREKVNHEFHEIQVCGKSSVFYEIGNIFLRGENEVLRLRVARMESIQSRWVAKPRDLSVDLPRQLAIFCNFVSYP